MKKKTANLLSFALALIALALILWFTRQDTDSETSSENLSEVTIMIYANDEELAHDTLEIPTDMTLIEIMEENYEMTVSDDGFVEAIEGVEQSIENNKFWVYEANEEMVTESAEDFIPEDGDTILWELLTF